MMDHVDVPPRQAGGRGTPGRGMGMPFEVNFDWASQAIIETVAVPFPSLETRPGVVVADPAVRNGALFNFHLAVQ